MASGTRSGRFQKNEETGNSRSKCAGEKVKGTEGITTSGSTTGSSRSRTTNGKTKELRSSTASGSAEPDTFNLRRSTRETPTKKMRVLSPIGNQSPSSSSDKSMSESAEKKKPPSPLRRSERIEKIGATSSSCSKKSNNSSSSPGNKKTNKDEKSGKLMVVATEEQRKDSKVDTKIGGLLKKEKRLDARSYRSFLKPQAKIAKRSDASRMHKKDDSTSLEDTVNAGASDAKELQEVGAECSERKGEELKYSDEGCKEPVEGSSSGSKELDGHSEKHKMSSFEAKEFNDESNSPVSICSDSSLQSSPIEITDKENGDGSVERENDCEGDTFNAYSLGREEPRSPELVESIFVEKSFAVDLDSRCNIGSSRSAMMTANLDSDNSVTPLKNGTSTSVAYAASSCPYGTANKNTERCRFCCKLQRVHTDLQDQEMCSCNAETRNHSSISVFEEARKPIAISGNPCEGASIARCSEEDIAEGDLKPESAEQSAGHKNENYLIASPCTSYVLLPVEEEASPEIPTDAGPNACVVCKNPGMLLCCDGKGCKRSYHISCLDPPLEDIPLGVWLCLSCVKKKMVLGVHSVSNGIESVWDIKEEMQNGKHYLVKYKGLAHVHNRWILENQMLLEAPMLLAKFNRRLQKEKVIRWRREWTEPHRLLQKRLLMPVEVADKYFSGHGNNSYCCYEWLVKWKGLGYEHATWEFENSPFLCSSVAISLIKNYESRHEEAKKASDPLITDKALQVKKNPFHKLSRLPDGIPPGLDNDHLNSTNRLREFWHRSQNAVLIDDQERILKTILFILALQSHTCRPFLIISTITSLQIWETELARFAPSVNIVVYSGNKDIRKMIRTVEFYEEGGCIMFQVLLSHPDAIVEDFEVLDCIGWEATIVDECQSSRISKHIEKLKHLSTDFRLLLLSGQLKDNHAEYLNLLSFLDSGGKANCFSRLKFDSKDTVGSLAMYKEKLARYLAYERKPDSSKFLEYWVPVRLSNLQLEQYCSTLISNFLILRSSSKIDHVGALRDILISTRKCCDHPYIVDPLLQSSLTYGLPEGKYLDIGVKASGKLLLLDKILQEIKNRGLRVLILFQSTGGAGRDSIGDILEDFLRQRFGADTYERLDNGLINSRKLAALNMFNDKSRGRFVFLIENRACLPTTKLSSVDAVIIFDSDWNPLNDLRALQKISIETHSEQVKVFRLYSCCTVEEKVLIFAKQDMLLDSNIQNIIPSVSHSLLSWGASYLFSKLDEFHQNDKLCDRSEISTDKKFLNDVVLDLLTQLSNKAEGGVTSDCSILVKAQQSGASYSRNFDLVGEKEGISSCDKVLPSFWSNLLEGRYPQWRYISESSQRIRRKVQKSDLSSKVSEAENDEMKRKRRKISINTNDPASLPNWVQDKRKEVTIAKDAMVPDNLPPSCSSNQPSPISQRKSAPNPNSLPKDPEVTRHLSKPHMVESERRDKLQNEQGFLHLLLRPDISKMCEILRLPANVKHMAEKFLEYTMSNLHVSRKPQTILQALTISLCWRSASFLKYKLDHKESLVLAREYLNFECDENEVETVYSKLRILKKKFSRRTGALRDDNELISPRNKSSVSGKDVPISDNELYSPENKSPMSGKDVPREYASKSATSDHHESEGGETISDYHRCTADVIMAQEQASVLETPAKLPENIGSLKDDLLKKRIDLIDKICSRREEMLFMKQQVELSDFNIHREQEKMKLKKENNTDLESIRAAYTDSIVRNNKIKCLNVEFYKKLVRFNQIMTSQRRKLAIMQADARNKERQIKDCWFEEAKAGRLAESFDSLPLSDSGFMLEVLDFSEQGGACDVSVLSSDEPLKKATITGPVEVIESNVNFSEIPSIAHNSGVDDEPVDTVTLVSLCNNMNELEPIQPIERYEGTPATVPPGVIGDIIVEIESLATVPPGVPVDTPNGGMEDILVETDILGSRYNNVDEDESVDPSRTSVENLVTDPSEVIGGMPMETESPASQFDIMITAGNRLDTMPVDSPNGGTEGMLVETEILGSRCNNVNEDEFVDRSGTFVENPATDPPGVIGGMPMETESPASQFINMVIEGNRFDTMPVDLPNGGTEGMLMETEILGSRCNYINEVESVDPSGTSVENPVTDPPGVIGEMPIETESPASQFDTLITAGNRHGTMANGSGTETLVDSEQNRGTATSGNACLISSPQSRAEFSSLAIASTSHVCENSALSNQGPSASEHERLDVSCVGCDQGISSPHQSVVPALNSVDVQVEQINHHPSVSDSIEFQLPSSTDIPLDEHAEGSTPVAMTSEDEPCYQTHCSSQQPDVAMQQSIVATAVQDEQSDPLPQLVTGPERTCSEDLSNTCYETRCSAQQTEMSSQQAIVAASVQVEQSSQPVLQFAVHTLPPSATTQPEGTSSEDLSSNVIQPESRSRFLERFQVTNWMPPQGMHPDPLQNELMRIRRQKDLLIKMQEDKKLLLKLECDQEIEKVRKKYDALLQDAEADFSRENKFFEEIHDKVSKNQALAEQFKARFIENRGGTLAFFQGSRASPVQQLLQTSHPQFAHRPASTIAPSSTPFPAPATLPPPVASTRIRASASVVPSVTPSQGIRRTSSAVLLGNQVRAHFSSTLPPRTNLQVGSEPRAPAPHLHRFRPQQKFPLQTTGMTSQQQQQPLANLGPASSAPPLVPSFPPVLQSMAPAGSGILPGCRGNSPPPIDLPLYTENFHIGAALPNPTPSVEVVPAFERMISSLADVELPPSSEGSTGPTAASDVVCISDDDD